MLSQESRNYEIFENEDLSDDESSDIDTAEEERMMEMEEQISNRASEELQDFEGALVIPPNHQSLDFGNLYPSEMSGQYIRVDNTISNTGRSLIHQVANAAYSQNSSQNQDNTYQVYGDSDSLFIQTQNNPEQLSNFLRSLNWFLTHSTQYTLDIRSSTINNQANNEDDIPPLVDIYDDEFDDDMPALVGSSDDEDDEQPMHNIAPRVRYDRDTLLHFMSGMHDSNIQAFSYNSYPSNFWEPVKVGVDDKLLNKLKVESHNLKNDNCAICLENFDKGMLLPCQHIYHQECIYEWLKASKNCPVCREEITEDSVNSNFIRKYQDDNQDAYAIILEEQIRIAKLQLIKASKIQKKVLKHKNRKYINNKYTNNKISKHQFTRNKTFFKKNHR